jgi:hypothetical protein
MRVRDKPRRINGDIRARKTSDKSGETERGARPKHPVVETLTRVADTGENGDQRGELKYPP